MNLNYPIYFSAGLTEKVCVRVRMCVCVCVCVCVIYHLFLLFYSWSVMSYIPPGKPLLQALHHMDQSEDPQHICPEEHV